MEDSAEFAPTEHLELAVDIVAAYVSNNSVPVADLPGLIGGVHAALTSLVGAPKASAPAMEKLTPAQIRKSISHDQLISFEDGKPYKTLRRHLTLRGLSPEAYREKWGLPRDYPMTAASYSAQRSELARALGLGQQRRKSVAARVVEPEASVQAAPAKKRGRKKAVAEAPGA